MSGSAGRWRRFGARLLLAAAVGAVFFEAGLRAVLTSPWTRDGALARAVGSPSRFAFSHEDLYWRFVSRLSTREAPTFEPPYDPSLGWTWPGTLPSTYAHVELQRLADRRPVFLFGDSYSACLTPPAHCFQGLMERSPLAEVCQLVNYGACGYGFDQTYLLTRAVVERFGGLDPVIVVGLLVEDDLSRMLLSLREYPKPRLRLEQGRLTVAAGPVRSRAEYLEDPDPLPASWALAWVRQALRSHPLEDARSTARAECESLTRAVLAELVADLRARDLDFFFLLFHTARTFPPGGSGDWRTRLVTGALDELDAPWYDVREELARRLAQDGGTIADFYIPQDQLGGGHYDADGNAAAFAVIERGLEQTAGLSAVSGGVPHPWAFETTFDDGGGTSNYVRRAAPPFDRVPDKDYVVLRAPGETPLSIRYKLDGRVRRFAAKLWAYQPDGESPPFALSASVDGRLVWERSVRPADEVLHFELDLRGAQILELSLAPHVFRGCAILADPVLE